MPKDNAVFDRFRTEQLEELIEYLEDEESEIAGEVIDLVKAEAFIKAAMCAGELEFCRAFRRRAERNLEARVRSN